MEKNKALFIVLEGSDGAGKNTQFNLLKERLKATGYDVSVFDFPRYSKESSYFIRQYLNGAYGKPTSLNPYTASLFYALDRFEAATEIKKALNEGKIVLSNRYVGSNMAHQGAKFTDPVEQRGFFVWDDNLEFQLLGIPRPDMSFFLRVPAEVSYKLIKNRAAKSGAKLDGHEADQSYLKKSLATYDVLCQLFPKDFRAIECTKDGKLLAIPEINNLIWHQLKPLLPAEKPHPSHSVVVSLSEQAANQAAANDRSIDLTHNFKNASLLFRLYLQRLPHIQLAPDFNMWADHNFAVYTPDTLPKEVGGAYKAINQRLTELYKGLQQSLVKYIENNLLDNNAELPKENAGRILLSVTPLSARSDISVVLKKSDIPAVAACLLASDSAELQWGAKQLYLAARQKWPNDFKEPLESRNGPESLNNIIAKLADERLPQAFSADSAIKLLEVRPRLEFDLLAESIYPYSSLSLDEIAEEVSGWPYLQKYDSLKEAAAQDEALKKVRYKLDILSDQITLNEVAAAAAINDVQVQAFTPRYGYEVPDIIEQAGADELYDEFFDESLKLYSILQAAGREDAAPYATLMGHKVRWQLDVDAWQLKNIIKASLLRDNAIISDISEKISEVHPLLWEVLRSTNSSPKADNHNGKSRVKSASRRKSTKHRGGKPKKS